MELEAIMYEYRAVVVSVYDGDTIKVDIDLGFGIWKKNETIRLWGIDAPEIRGEEREAGLKARDSLRRLILGEDVIIQTEKDEKGKYGRYIGRVILHGACVSTIMVVRELAEFKEY